MFPFLYHVQMCAKVIPRACNSAVSVLFLYWNVDHFSQRVKTTSDVSKIWMKGDGPEYLEFWYCHFFPAIVDSSSTCLSNHPNGSRFQDSIWTIRNNDRFGSSEKLICMEFAESSLIIFSFFPSQRITSDHFLQEENNRVRRAKENMAEELNHPNTVGWWT